MRIKYDLWGGEEPGKSKRVERSHSPKTKATKAKATARKKPLKLKRDPDQEKVIAFVPSKKADSDPEGEEIAELKEQVRKAMEVLEQGKQIAAFNLLKRIVKI